VRRVVGRVDPAKTAIRAVMTPDPEAVSFADSIATVLNKMTVGGFRHVPLVDLQRRPVGIVSIKDVVEYFVERFPKHVLNVAPDPLVRHPDEIAGAG
jgi:predicted transcriptional regulator